MTASRRGTQQISVGRVGILALRLVRLSHGQQLGLSSSLGRVKHWWGVFEKLVLAQQNYFPWTFIPTDIPCGGTLY